MIFEYLVLLLTTFLRPFVAGVIVTYRSWRVIFYLQAALGALATVMVFFLQPETIHRKRSDELVGMSPWKKASQIWEWTNPLRVIKLYRYPNLVHTIFSFVLLIVLNPFS